jgi:hypothetical protein
MCIHTKNKESHSSNNTHIEHSQKKNKKVMEQSLPRKMKKCPKT